MKIALKDLPYGELLYKAYWRMMIRAYDKNMDCYKNYGGRGIIVCEEWCNKENGFNNFYNWSIQNGFYYDKQGTKYNNCTLDRIDNDKGYSPDNCRWVSRKVQNNNKRDNINYEIDGKTMSLRAWCGEYNMPYLPVYLRVKRRGWDIKKALFTPIGGCSLLSYKGESKTPNEWAKEYGIAKSSFSYHIKNGKDVEQVLKHFGKI